jgi:hypothetical protein
MGFMITSRFIFAVVASVSAASSGTPIRGEEPPLSLSRAALPTYHENPAL